MCAQQDIDYITAGKDAAVESLRKLIYDFFGAENAIHASQGCNEITEWSNRVVEIKE